MVKCKSVWVKFRDRNVQGQHLMVGDQSGASYMKVYIDPELQVLEVQYYFFRKDTRELTDRDYKDTERLLKAVSWPLDVVQEWSAEDMVD